MKVTAYIQFSNDPKRNLIDLDVIQISVAGKAGFITVTTKTPVEGLIEDAPDENEYPRYVFSLEEVVDFIGKDSLDSDKKRSPTPVAENKPKTEPAKKERKPYTKKEQEKVVKAPKKAAKNVVPVAKKADAAKEKIKADATALPVVDVLKSLRRNNTVSNRASGTINAVAEKLGLQEDWHSFLSLMTKEEWAKQENVGKTIMDLLPILYKKSGVELKD